MPRLAMLIDLTRCIGCDACTVACKQENGTPVDTFFARVLNIEAGEYPNVKRVYLPVLCNHCDDAPCLKACPNKAIFRRDDGIVLIDQDRCKGTGACVSACPYGNVYLEKVDRWYLGDDAKYETEFVRPRLNKRVARKCTYCAHRVDQGLDPACVVACPTTARIFGDLEDPTSTVSQYIRDQESETNRKPFHLLPECKTSPATSYLGTMATQDQAVLGTSPEAGVSMAAVPDLSRPPKTPLLSRFVARILAMFALFLLCCAAGGDENSTDVYSTSTCVGCHGSSAMGGMGSPLARTKLTDEEFAKIVRQGKGMMPAFSEADLPRAQLMAIQSEVRAMPWKPSQIPIAYRVGSLLTPGSLSKFFLVVFGFAFIFAIRPLVYWLDLTGIWQARKHIARLGLGKAAWIAVRALIVDGFLVASLWRRDKFRWFMHGLMLYGFCGLMLADILLAIFNPARGHLPLTDPLKMLPVLSGLAVFVGICYVKFRYQRDKYIDNGLTLGRDFLFVNLLFHTIGSGFFVYVLKAGAPGWIMTIYLYHLACVTLLIATAPFTRFSHAWIVPCLAAATRLMEAVTESGADLGYQREPSPGRHHKSERIAMQVIERLDPEVARKVRIRYYP